ncbi:MAG: prepilin-type N-terminal cleavage/methylation domain-containing protein [Candidatus Scalinduaceae bacterium]
MIEKDRNANSFTLIEVIIVLVIVTVVGMISIPRVTNAIESARFRGAISKLITFLRNTHLEAVLTRKDMDVTVDFEENILKRNDGQLFILPPEIILKPEEIDDYDMMKYTFFNNGRGTGPKIQLIGSNERKATVYVDSLSGLARYDFK